MTIQLPQVRDNKIPLKFSVISLWWKYDYFHCRSNTSLTIVCCVLKLLENSLWVKENRQVCSARFVCIHILIINCQILVLYFLQSLAHNTKEYFAHTYWPNTYAYIQLNTLLSQLLSLILAFSFHFHFINPSLIRYVHLHPHLWSTTLQFLTTMLAGWNRAANITCVTVTMYGTTCEQLR